MLTIAFIMLQGERDDKIIAVCADDPEFRHYTDIKEIPPHRLAEIRRFFEDCIHLKCIYTKIHIQFVKTFHRFFFILVSLIPFFLDISWTKKTRRTRTRKSTSKTSCQRRLPSMPSSTPCKLPCFFSDLPLQVSGLRSCFYLTQSWFLFVGTCMLLT